MVIACDRGMFHDPCGPCPVCVWHLIRRALRGDNVTVIETGLVSRDGRKEYFRARLRTQSDPAGYRRGPVFTKGCLGVQAP